MVYCFSKRIGRRAVTTVLQVGMSKMRKTEASKRLYGNAMKMPTTDTEKRQGSGARGLVAVLLCLILAISSVLAASIFSHHTLLCVIDRDEKLR